MQVPEKLALIGGSILLSSTLIFTLKSQASSIIPHVSSSISHVFDHIGDAKRSSDFNNNFKEAQQKGWQTGHWGTSKYYIDNDMNMHVGAGQLQGNLISLLGSNLASNVRTINIDQSIQAPQDSTTLFSTSPLYNGMNNSNLSVINGLDNVSTSHVTNITSLFCGDNKLKKIDGINSWDVSNVRENHFATVFADTAINQLDLSNWHAHDFKDMGHMFAGNSNLTSLNISNFDNGKSAMGQLFGSNHDDWSTQDTKLSNITLGNKTILSNIGYFPNGTWQNGNQTLKSQQLLDGNVHPGTWIKQ